MDNQNHNDLAAIYKFTCSLKSLTTLRQNGLSGMRPTRVPLIIMVACGFMNGCQQQKPVQTTRRAGENLVHQQPAKASLSQEYSAADLLTAYKVANGQPVAQDSQDAASDTDEASVSEPAAIIDIAPQLVALLVKNTIPNGCHACSGDYSIYYLKKTTAGFDVLGKWPNIGGQGEWGTAADWSKRLDLTTYPALIFSSSGGAQGCHLTSVDIVEMTPTRPIVRGSDITTSMDYNVDGLFSSAPKNETGTIKRGSDDDSFTVSYRGTNNFTTITTGFSNGPAILDGEAKEKISC